MSSQVAPRPYRGCVESTGEVPATFPCSPFTVDGFCRSCGGFTEHFSRCPHATWEARELA